MPAAVGFFKRYFAGFCVGQAEKPGIRDFCKKNLKNSLNSLWNFSEEFGIIF